MADRIGYKEERRKGVKERPKEEGPKEDISKEELNKAEKELRKAVKSSHEVLASANTVFPFTLFPNTITIDREKFTITSRFFFSVASVRSILLEDILDVTASAGPFFGSLHIVSRGINPDKPFDVNFLWRQDALKLKRILSGYTILSTKKNVNLEAIPTNELIKMLDNAGRDTDANVA